MKQDYQQSLERAKNRIIQDKDSQRLLRLMAENRLSRLTNKNKRKINYLAQLGVVNLYMDDTVSLSRLGKHLLRFKNVIKELGI
jgi:hypothetical protein